MHAQGGCLERLNADNIHQAILPTTLATMEAELPECIQELVSAAMGEGEASSTTLPLWYVLTKASGATGIPLAQLYNDPMVRHHALAAMAADAEAQRRVAMAQQMRQQPA